MKTISQFGDKRLLQNGTKTIDNQPQIFVVEGSMANHINCNVTQYY